MMLRPLDAVPIITIGGFLGAGKTTLVNHILSESRGRRIVVFVNDFGAINIDYDLIETVEEDRIALTNGCVCCSLNDDLVTAIVDYCHLSQRPDAFVIEASGVADPRSLDQSILALEAAGHVTLETRVYVLDADRFGSWDYADTELLIDHAAASDLVLLNKVDLAGADQLTKLRSTLTRSSPYSQILETRHCAVPSDTLLGSEVIDTFSQDQRMQRSPTSHKLQSHDFSSWEATANSPLDRERFQAFLQAISNMTLRAKGRLIFNDDPKKVFFFDLVGDRQTHRLSSAKPKDHVSSIIAIGPGKRFNRDYFEREFLKLQADDSD